MRSLILQNKAVAMLGSIQPAHRRNRSRTSAEQLKTR